MVRKMSETGSAGSLELLVKAMDSAIWELGEGFKGLPDEDVWRRADPRLLSIGELACHVCYWEAESFLGTEFESPLVTAAARYYTTHVDQPFSLPMGADDVFREVQRIHVACAASLRANPPDPEADSPYRKDWKWGTLVEYQAFHIAYHTGQVYSVRHLLGHQPVDN